MTGVFESMAVAFLASRNPQDLPVFCDTLTEVFADIA
jgi:hypothetical protein